MKKVFKLTALLLLVGALLVGCKSNADEKLPGNWTTTAEYFERTSGLFKGTGPSYVYKDDYSGSRKSYPTEANTFNYSVGVITKTANYTGFKATAKSSPADALYGFAFMLSIDDNDAWSYYSLIIDDDAFLIKQTLADKSTVLCDWEKNDAIKPVTGQNVVTVYTENSSIKIFINNTLVKTIASPVLRSGYCGILGCVTYEEFIASTPVTTTYTFEKFQY